MWAIQQDYEDDRGNPQIKNDRSGWQGPLQGFQVAFVREGSHCFVIVLARITHRHCLKGTCAHTHSHRMRGFGVGCFHGVSVGHQLNALFECKGPCRGEGPVWPADTLPCLVYPPHAMKPLVCWRDWPLPLGLLSQPILLCYKMFYSLCDSEASFIPGKSLTAGERPVRLQGFCGAPARLQDSSRNSRKKKKSQPLRAFRSPRDGWSSSSRIQN